MLSGKLKVIGVTSLVAIFSISPVQAKDKSSLKKLIDFGVSAVVNYGIHQALEYTLDSGKANAAMASASTIDAAEIQDVLVGNSRSEQERAELAEATFSVLQYYEYIRKRDTTAVQGTWLDPFSDIAIRARDLTEKYGAKCDVNDGNKRAYQPGQVVLAVEVVCYEAKQNVTYEIDYLLQKTGDKWKIASTDGKRLGTSDGWYRVVAEPHLNVRKTPKLAAASIGTVSDGSKVKILTRAGQQQEISGRNGYWSKIEYQNGSGWVFDAWLERVN